MGASRGAGAVAGAAPHPLGGEVPLLGDRRADQLRQQPGPPVVPGEPDVAKACLPGPDTAVLGWQVPCAPVQKCHTKPIHCEERRADGRGP